MVKKLNHINTDLFHSAVSRVLPARQPARQHALPVLLAPEGAAQGEAAEAGRVEPPEGTKGVPPSNGGRERQLV